MVLASPSSMRRPARGCTGLARRRVRGGGLPFPLTFERPFTTHMYSTRRPARRTRCQGGALDRVGDVGEGGAARAFRERETTMGVGPEKEKAIELAVSSIEKAFGKGSIMRLGNDEALVKDIQAVSTGSISLDIALGVGGFPRGRIIEIYGPESSGKTTLDRKSVV